MSRVHVMVALGVALALTIATLLVLSRPPATGRGRPGTPLLGIDPARVNALRVSRPDGTIESIRHGRRIGEWEFTTIRGGTEAAPWPVDAARVRAGLRILAALVRDDPGTGSAGVEPGAPVLSIESDGAPGVSIRISAHALSGRVLAEIARTEGETPVVSWVGSDLADVFVNSGLRAWRDESAIPGIGPEVSRITLTTGAARLALARVQGRWSVIEPALGIADEEAITRLLGALGSVRILDFMDEGAPTDAGVDGPTSPQATVSVEWDLREASGDSVVSRTLVRTLAVGRAADIGDARRFVALASAVRGPGQGSDSGAARIVQVASAALAAIPTDAAGYVSRLAVGVSVSDVAGIAIARSGSDAAAYRRTIEGWERATTGATGVRATKGAEDALADLVGLLTGARAEHVELIAPVGFAPAWRVSLSRLDGIELGSVEIEVGSDGVMVVHSGPVWRVYDASASTRFTRDADALGPGGS